LKNTHPLYKVYKVFKFIKCNKSRLVNQRASVRRFWLDPHVLMVLHVLNSVPPFPFTHDEPLLYLK
jgi:recombinational DNA repair ATPase RecF